MELNANSGGRRTPANDQEKWMFGFGRVRGLVCTIAVSLGNSSFSGRHIGKSFEISLNNLLFSQHIRIVGCYYSVICLILLYRTFCKILENTGQLFLAYLMFF